MAGRASLSFLFQPIKADRTPTPETRTLPIPKTRTPSAPALEPGRVTSPIMIPGGSRSLHSAPVPRFLLPFDRSEQQLDEPFIKEFVDINPLLGRLNSIWNTYKNDPTKLTLELKKILFDLINEPLEKKEALDIFPEEEEKKSLPVYSAERSISEFISFLKIRRVKINRRELSEMSSDIFFLRTILSSNKTLDEILTELSPRAVGLEQENIPQELLDQFYKVLNDRFPHQALKISAFASNPLDFHS
ncbi:MAG: hypothetical protein HZB76_06350 [Chlamydiae bacterium]|nr:hypothetical protein [Chlamydiota bacterium]